MRFIPIFLIIFIFALRVPAASTVSGVAVAAQWTGNMMDYGGFGKIMKYVVTSGAVTSRSVLHAGPSRYATFRPDGQKVAFINKDSSIAYLGINGGTPAVLVTDLVSATGFLDWPTGDWVYYSLGGLEDDGSKEVWKVNINTRQTAKVMSFDTSRIWQFGMSNDATKACARPIQPAGSYRFPVSSTISFSTGGTYWFGDGCGVAMSPDGAYTMRLNSTAHAGIDFHAWDSKAKVKSINLATMASWGEFFGVGMNNNRWSCNDYKWICLSTGWEHRGAALGSTVAIANWIDSQTVLLSDGKESTTMFTGQQNEAGDFWVGTPSTPVQSERAIVPKAANARHGTYTPVLSHGRTNKALSGNARAWDLQGRALSAARPGVRFPAVYLVEKNK